MPPWKAYTEQDLWDAIQVRGRSNSSRACLKLFCIMLDITVHLCGVQDNFNQVVLIGGMIKMQDDGPWKKYGAPVITRRLQIIGSCAAFGGQCFVDGNDKVSNHSHPQGPNPSLMSTSQNCSLRLTQVPQVFAISTTNARVTMRNIRFTGTVGEQGAVSISQGAVADFWYCDFSQNEGTVGAGVAVIDDYSVAQFHYSAFSQNKATGNGAAVYISSATAFFTNCSFTDNEVRLRVVLQRSCLASMVWVTCCMCSMTPKNNS